MTNTIQFNTRRLYSAEGQVITATLHDDGVVTFMDHSRMIDGEFLLGDVAAFSQQVVLRRYDHGQYGASARSRADGMMRGGCNLRKEVAL
jgi:hypothetical protein